MIMQELEEMDRKKYVAFKSYSEMGGEKTDGPKNVPYDIAGLTYVEP